MFGKTIVLTTLCLSLASTLAAQEMKGMDHSSMSKDKSISTKAFQGANAQMHKDMTIEYSGDTDVDFVRGMIAHHKGAIAMAKVELAHGNDAKLRKLAEDIVKAQEAEITEMQAWLKAQGK
ncbi:DUF305 domain-containing protein [Rhizobium deserti]|uniref:DUF305 domain-containing protein n=1 Tax=Rhizobium deserti TaxID=2547961 RepID=A0A4R5UKV4_9HYPH|nr:DUF305 domain-containing protein [Rhizobium deserti]TDK37536.1 DUF305 domain-containing protein [Rhizobium deserti]